MADEGDELRLRQLEEARADVVAHVAKLPKGKRKRMRTTVDATLARLDAEIARLAEEPGAELAPAPPDASPPTDD